MTRTFIQLAIVTTAVAVVGPALAAPRSVPTAEPAAEPTPAATMTGLCGITQGDLADIIEHYDLEPDMDAVADMLATPFDCSAYGNLCAAVGATNAHTYVCDTWENFRDHESTLHIREHALDQLTTWGTTCTADTEECADACAPDGVLHCEAITIGGSCKNLVICDDWKVRPLWGFGPFVFEKQGPLG